MTQTATFDIGDLARVGRECMGNEPGSLAVCYETYARSDGTEGVSLLFPNGCYDGFSSRDLSLFRVERVGHVAALSGYVFRNVQQLDADFRAGRFDLAWR